MHLKKFLAVAIISLLIITGCTGKNDKVTPPDNQESPKQEEKVENSSEDIKMARKSIIEGKYEEAEAILVLALAENEEDESVNILYRQVKLLNEIEKKIKDKKYDEARVRCTILSLEEKLDTVVSYEVEKLQEKLDKLGTVKSSDSKKNRNVKIDKNKDISPQKAMDIVRDYIKKTYPGTKAQISISDMYSIDGQSYYYVYAYRIKYVGGCAKEEAIAYYDVNMRTGKIVEYLICNPNYKVNISEDKAKYLAGKYMEKYTEYKAETFEIISISSECGDTFYCIEAYGRDDNNNLVNVGYFEVHVETGVVRGDVYPPEIKQEPPSVSQPEQPKEEVPQQPEVPNQEENTEQEVTPKPDQPKEEETQETLVLETQEIITE